MTHEKTVMYVNFLIRSSSSANSSDRAVPLSRKYLCKYFCNEAKGVLETGLRTTLLSTRKCDMY